MCRTCAEKGQMAACGHDENSRSFTSVWTLREIAYSVTLGYKILDTYEAWVYLESEPIFKDFLEVLAKYKVI